ncbi:hypothetical protein ACFV06_37885 [Streptomyces sp. NPDC059618]|uniref:hypothetical protein n=1 Tax=Streptomyces sp. NPDC059618 TaxID=3346887 RepID=UPI0036AD1A5C
MTAFSWSAVLVVGTEQAVVEVELGELTPAKSPEWGGLLRGVPVRLAAEMRQGVPSRLRLTDGQERSVRPVGVPWMSDQGFLIVAFLGEGTAPTG